MIDDTIEITDSDRQMPCAGCTKWQNQAGRWICLEMLYGPGKPCNRYISREGKTQ